MRRIPSLFLLSALLFFTMCTADAQKESPSVQQPIPENAATAYFAAGCFWCVEAVFESVEGVHEAVSGYAGGRETEPTYSQVSAGRTGHAETVKVIYNPLVVSYASLLKVYYGSHNPTTVNGQHPDYGKQYRSIVFYQNEREKMAVQSFISQLDASGLYNEPIATEVLPFTTFWPAEGYHQNYERLHPNDPYVRSVSIPRLRQFQRQFPDLLKEEVRNEL